MQRYFASHSNETITLGESDSYHIKTVMRNKVGDKLEVVAGGATYLYEIIALDKLVTLKLLEKLEESVTSYDINIVQSLVTDQKMSYIIQKTTELGVAKIIPYASSRSVVKLKEAKFDRWQKIAKEASEQSKRQSIPQIAQIHSLKELLTLEADKKILCTVNEKENTIKKVLNKITKDDRIIIVIGPEGGFTKEEEESLVKAGYISTSLGSLVMRTETASSYVLSVINYQLME